MQEILPRQPNWDTSPEILRQRKSLAGCCLFVTSIESTFLIPNAMIGVDNVNDEKVEELTSVLPACSRKVSRQKSRAVTFDLEEKETSAGELEESSTLPLEIPRRKEY